jgi:hypothetical protein
MPSGNSRKNESTIHERGDPKLKLLPDGSISNKRVERYILFLVDEVPGAQAWRLAGYRNEGGSLAYRRKIEALPEFQLRLDNLMREKAEVMADEVFGEAKHMASQLWREARALGDSKMMIDAAKMRLTIAEKEAGQRPAAETPSGRGPGRTAVENTAEKTGIDSIRQRLLDKGVAMPGSPTEQQAAAPVAVQKPAAAPAAEPEPMGMDLDTMLKRVRAPGAPAAAA